MKRLHLTQKIKRLLEDAYYSDLPYVVIELPDGRWIDNRTDKEVKREWWPEDLSDFPLLVIARQKMPEDE